MGTELLNDRFADQIVGVLSCYDRLIIQGTIPDFCYGQAMTNYLNAHQIRIFDYPQFAQPLRDQLREHAEQIAAENEIPIEFIRKSGIRKSDKIQELVDKRGSHPGARGDPLGDGALFDPSSTRTHVVLIVTRFRRITSYPPESIVNVARSFKGCAPRL
jgi:hypothetical protein